MTDKQTTNPDIDHVAIERHYAHAVEKHPHFADLMDWNWNLYQSNRELSNCRFTIRENLSTTGYVTAKSVLMCEVAEIFDAYHRSDYAAAVEECHDAIAVLLRMAKMIADIAKEGEVAE